MRLIRLHIEFQEALFLTEILWCGWSTLFSRSVCEVLTWSSRVRVLPPPTRFFTLYQRFFISSLRALFRFVVSMSVNPDPNGLCIVSFAESFYLAACWYHFSCVLFVTFCPFRRSPWQILRLPRHLARLHLWRDKPLDFATVAKLLITCLSVLCAFALFPPTRVCCSQPSHANALGLA